MADIPMPEPARVAPVLGVIQNVYTAEQMRAYAAADNAALRAELANARAADIHSCHAGCTRAGCVNARLREERDQLRDEIKAMRKSWEMLANASIEFAEYLKPRMNPQKATMVGKLRKAFDVARKATP